jgi:hypothetical protein
MRPLFFYLSVAAWGTLPESEKLVGAGEDFYLTDPIENIDHYFIASSQLEDLSNMSQLFDSPARNTRTDDEIILPDFGDHALLDHLFQFVESSPARSKAEIVQREISRFLDKDPNGRVAKLVPTVNRELATAGYDPVKYKYIWDRHKGEKRKRESPVDLHRGETKKRESPSDIP